MFLDIVMYPFITFKSKFSKKSLKKKKPSKNGRLGSQGVALIVDIIITEIFL